MTVRCAVLGSPVRHSLSPVLHRAAYAELGLDWEYDAVEVREEQLAGFLDGLDDSWRGLSLTMPLKRAVVPLLDSMTEEAVLARAANTVVLEDGRRTGHNTDIPGAVTALQERLTGRPDRVVVLGGGATAASVLLALSELGASRAWVVVRDPGRVTETLAAVGRHPRRPAVDVVTFREAAATSVSMRPDLLVSTIPVDAQGEAVLRLGAAASVIFDVVYDPWPTPLARLAATEGRTLVSGLDLLVHQAVRQLQLMAGVDASPLEAMRRAGEQALQDRVARREAGRTGAGHLGAGERSVHKES